MRRSASACTATRCATAWTACASRPAAIPTSPSSAWSSGSRSSRARRSRRVTFEHPPDVAHSRHGGLMATKTDHRWAHFPRTIDAPPIVVERAEGCYIYDSGGNRYLDALSALYCVNIGYGPWPEIGEAAKRQLDTLPFFHNWVGFATPPALQLADKLAEPMQIDVGRGFFVGGGSEAI